MGRAEQVAPATVRLLVYLAQLLTPCREVQTPVCVSRRRIEWDT